MSIIKFILIFVTVCSLGSFGNAISINIKVKVENEVITNIDIEKEKNYLFFLNPKLRELNESKTFEIAKNSLITEVIKKRELDRVFNYERENNVVNIIERNLLQRKKIKDKDELLEILNDNDIEYENFRNKLKTEGLWNQLVYQKYNKNIRISEKNLRANIIKQFENKKKKFEYNLSEILIGEILEGDINKILLKINKSINEIGFENTANIFSISNTSKNGGLIGWINELQISKEINENLKNLKINNVTKPIKMQTGYLLIKLNDKRELSEKIDVDNEVEKLKIKETNRQLNNYSTIFFKKLKKNTKIYEY